MKSTKYIFIVFLASVIAIWASSSVIQNFTAESNGDSVTIRWTSAEEDGVQRYELERSTPSNSFDRLANFVAKGSSSSYSFVDNEAFMKDGLSGNNDLVAQKTYNYKLRIVYKNNKFAYSDMVTVQHKPSSIRRTWGMIKEMFR